AAPWGIVYATDAMAEPRVSLRGVFPETSHAPITYPAALVAGGDPKGADFLTFLGGPEMRAVFDAAGFLAVPTP
ncbi:MAG: substrate-binding domain-containing protein, partial [Pseudomonadota bacterium]|nr:substrate-binding domain-containing protein [Pseudomonadota bacterium]